METNDWNLLHISKEQLIIGFLFKNFVGPEMFRHFSVTIEQVKISKSNV